MSFAIPSKKRWRVLGLEACEQVCDLFTVGIINHGRTKWTPKKGGSSRTSPVRSESSLVFSGRTVHIRHRFDSPRLRLSRGVFLSAGSALFLHPEVASASSAILTPIAAENPSELHLRRKSFESIVSFLRSIPHLLVLLVSTGLQSQHISAGHRANVQVTLRVGDL